MTAVATEPADSAEPESARQVAGRRVRHWRGIVLTLAALVLLAIVLAALKPEATGGYLDPDSPRPEGGRALAEILRGHGTPVEVRRSVEGRFNSLPSTVIVIVHSERLTADDLDALTYVPGDLVLVEPTRKALAALAPGVEQAVPVGGGAEPGCAPGPIAAAGGVDFGDSYVYTAPATATRCYLDADEKLPRLVQLSTGGRTVTVVGSGSPFTNRELAEGGNAALGMNLAGAGSRAIWLMPDLPRSGEGTAEEGFVDLVPDGVVLFLWQLLIGVVLLALWRVRRLGPVIVERLPVVVRSAETVEGRSRLYRAAHARDRAAVALRESSRERLVPLLGLPRSAAADPARAGEIVSLVVARAGLDQQTAQWALYGPDPGDDRELIWLTEVLDDLEGRVR